MENLSCSLQNEDIWRAFWKESKWDASRVDGIYSLFLTHSSAKTNPRAICVDDLAALFSEFPKYPTCLNYDKLVSIICGDTSTLNPQQLLRLVGLMDMNTSHEIQNPSGRLRLSLIFSYYDKNNKGFLSKMDLQNLVDDIKKANCTTQINDLVHLNDSIHFEDFVKAVNSRQIRGTSQIMRADILACDETSENNKSKKQNMQKSQLVREILSTHANIVPIGGPTHAHTIESTQHVFNTVHKNRLPYFQGASSYGDGLMTQKNTGARKVGCETIEIDTAPRQYTESYENKKQNKKEKIIVTPRTSRGLKVTNNVCIVKQDVDAFVDACQRTNMEADRIAILLCLQKLAVSESNNLCKANNPPLYQICIAIEQAFLAEEDGAEGPEITNGVMKELSHVIKRLIHDSDSESDTDAFLVLHHHRVESVRDWESLIASHTHTSGSLEKAQHKLFELARRFALAAQMLEKNATLLFASNETKNQPENKNHFANQQKNPKTLQKTSPFHENSVKQLSASQTLGEDSEIISHTHKSFRYTRTPVTIAASQSCVCRNEQFPLHMLDRQPSDLPPRRKFEDDMTPDRME